MKKGNHDEINFWQSHTDILSALLLVIMLVMLLLILYLMNAPQTDWDYIGNATPTPSPTATPHYGDGDFDDDDEDDHDWTSGGGDGSEHHTPEPYVTPSITPTVTITPTPTPYNPAGGGGGNGGSDPYGEMNKAAVYAMIVDSETERVIPKAGIVFELFDVKNSRQTLNTYYPERIWYQDFETTELGTFYLPEKILLNTYSFRAQNAPEGYDLPESASFSLDEPYDWPEPYVVRIPFAPSKNVIHIRMTDAETTAGIPNGTFRVIAAQDIITPDGTMRYARGEVADIIKCDENGEGQSIELYLGEYTVVQENIPQYYAGLQNSDQVLVRKKDVFDTAVYLDYACQKTQLIVHAADAAYPATPLENLEFSVWRAGEEHMVQTFTTDSTGIFKLTDLEKSSTYYVQQNSALPDYRFQTDAYEIRVSEQGLIEEVPIWQLEIPNRIVRVRISLKDTLLGTVRSDISAGLYDENGNTVRLWTTTAMPETFVGLAPGRYSLVVDGNSKNQQTFVVEDTSEIQTIEHSLWSTTDTAIGASGIAAICLTSVLALRLRSRKHSNKRRK